MRTVHTENKYIRYDKLQNNRSLRQMGFQESGKRGLRYGPNQTAPDQTDISARTFPHEPGLANIRFAPKSGLSTPVAVCPLRADFVAEVR